MNERLKQGDPPLVSINKRYSLYMQSDGNVVVYKQGVGAIFDTGTFRTGRPGPFFLVVQVSQDFNWKYHDGQKGEISRAIITWWFMMELVTLFGTREPLDAVWHLLGWRCKTTEIWCFMIKILEHCGVLARFSHCKPSTFGVCLASYRNYNWNNDDIHIYLFSISFFFLSHSSKTIYTSIWGEFLNKFLGYYQ